MIPKSNPEYKEVLSVKKEYERSILSTRNVVGCAVGLKESEGGVMKDNDILIKVFVDREESKMKDSLLSFIDGVEIDVRESFPIIGTSAINSSYDEFKLSVPPAEKCLEKQKKFCLDEEIQNKVDSAVSMPVKIEDIKTAIEETGLFKEEFDRQIEQYEGKGLRKGVEVGDSTGIYRVPIGQVFPNGDRFMEALVKQVKKKENNSEKDPTQGDKFTTPSGKMPGIGEITGDGQPALGMKVKKKGRTSGITEGTVIALDASLFIDYPPNFAGGQDKSNLGHPSFSPSPKDGGKFPRDITGLLWGFTPIEFPPKEKIEECKKSIGTMKSRTLFTEQIVTTRMAEPGDSGASLISAECEVVGLLFAGSENYTFFNTQENVSQRERYIEVENNSPS